MKAKANDKRVISGEGFLLADAVLTQVGDLPYTRGELGMEGNPRDIITLRRSEDVLKEALPSMKGAPVTIGHPPQFVGTGDAKRNVVGAVVTEPKLGTDGKVRASIRLYDDQAISMVQGGDDQLSPGFNFIPTNLTDTGGDISQMSVNHVAIVPRGRAGEAVRVLDHLPPTIGIDTNSSEDAMGNHDQIAQAVSQAIDAAFKTSANQGMSDTDVRKAIGDSITSALAPVVEGMKTLTEKQAKDEAAAEAKKAEDAASAERDKIIDEVHKAERARFSLLQDAMPFIPEDKREGVDELSAEDILKRALGDSLPNVEGYSEDRLRGILEGRIAAAKDAAANQQVVDAGMVTRTPMSEKKAKDVYKSRYNKARGMKEED